MKRYARTALALVVCLFEAMAQTSTSQLGGTVTDPSGAQVPDAIVTLLNEATGIAQKQLTTQAGCSPSRQFQWAPTRCAWRRWVSRFTKNAGTRCR